MINDVTYSARAGCELAGFRHFKLFAVSLKNYVTLLEWKKVRGGLLCLVNYFLMFMIMTANMLLSALLILSRRLKMKS